MQRMQRALRYKILHRYRLIFVCFNCGTEKDEGNDDEDLFLYLGDVADIDQNHC